MARQGTARRVYRTCQKRKGFIMRVTLNIGLSINGIDGGTLQEARVDTYLGIVSTSYVSRISVQNYTTDDGTPVTERTVIASADLDPDYMTQTVEFLSDVLEQDCIAWSVDNGATGTLSGSRSADYGGYNPDYFLPW